MKFKNAKQQQLFYVAVAVLIVLGAVMAVNIVIKKRQLEAIRITQKIEEQRLQQQMDTTLRQIERPQENDDETDVFSLTEGQSGLQMKAQTVGNAIHVETLVLEKPGFIAIYEDNAGEPGTLINTSPFLSRGLYSVISIALPETPKKGDFFHATIHFDENDDGRFNNAFDKPIRNVEGVMQTTRFTVTEEDPIIN